MPVRWLTGPGLLIVGAGLLLMRGLHAQSPWTHLIPGLLVAGLGIGMVMQLGNIAIPKSVTPPRIRQNIDIFDFTLDEDQMRQLNRLATGERIGPDPDTYNAFNAGAREASTYGAAPGALFGLE